MAFAEKTSVPVQQTKNAIETLIAKKGGTAFGIFTERVGSMIVFEMHDRRIRFVMPFPEKMTDQALRSRWRALLLVIKAKLESVEAGIETFEEAFLAHVMMPDGQTVGEHAIPNIALTYQSEIMQPLLPAPKRDD